MSGMEDEEATSIQEELFPGHTDASSYIQEAFQDLMKATKSSNNLPGCGDDFDYYSSFESFRRLMDIEGTRVLQVIHKMMRYLGVKGTMSVRSGDSVDAEDKFDSVVDANDQLLERAGTYLDEAAGLKKTDNPLIVTAVTPRLTAVGSWNKKLAAKSSSLSPSYRLLAAKNIARPQVSFKDKIDNTNCPFVPKLKVKPHASRSLHESLMVNTPTEKLDESLDEETGIRYPHPYQYELDHFTPTTVQLQRTEPQVVKSLEETPLKYVDSVAGLTELCQLLKTQSEIAVDLENHSYRSFQGFLCLMQISTRSMDFLVDTLTLRADLWRLNEVFTDPTIVKVFHGADLDIEWLQRDLGLYVVNMFDTGQAARLLNFQRLSLAYLLAHYCQVNADKQFQLADWRIRPLPEELVKYAREDTHYLLYIYDMMEKELLDRGNDQSNLLLSVLDRSRQLCLKRYEKNLFHEDSHMDLYKRSKKVFNSQQMAALKGIYAWRDKIARIEDESTGYVLPNHMLLQIADVLPRETQGVLACCNPIPPLVRQSLNEIHSIIRDARDKQLSKVVLPRPAVGPTRLQHPCYSVDNLLNCPHDMSHTNKQPAALQSTVSPLLVATTSSMFKDAEGHQTAKVKVKESPLLAAFSNSTEKPKVLEAQKKASSIQNSFVSPFEKYLPSEVSKREKPVSTVIKKPKGELWKLVPNTPAQSTVRAPMSSGSTEAVRSKTETAQQSFIKPATDTESVPLRHLFKRKHSEVSKDTPTKSPIAATSKKQKKDKVTMETVEAGSFQSHDYQGQGFQMFQGTGSGSQHHGKGRRRDYNPNESQDHGKQKSFFRQRGTRGGGKKSMTYSKSKADRLPNIAWPKR